MSSSGDVHIVGGGGGGVRTRVRRDNDGIRPRLVAAGCGVEFEAFEKSFCCFFTRSSALVANVGAM